MHLFSCNLLSKVYFAVPQRILAQEFLEVARRFQNPCVALRASGSDPGVYHNVYDPGKNLRIFIPGFKPSNLL